MHVGEVRGQADTFLYSGWSFISFIFLGVIVDTELFRAVKISSIPTIAGLVLDFDEFRIDIDNASFTRKFNSAPVKFSVRSAIRESTQSLVPGSSTTRPLYFFVASLSEALSILILS